MKLPSTRQLLALLSTLTGLVFGLALAAPNALAGPASDGSGRLTNPAEAAEALADLSIAKSGAPDPVAAGATLAYTITATNNDALDVTNVVITDTLPLSVTFSSASPGCSYLAGPHQVSCLLASLPMTPTTSLTLAVQVDPAASGSLINEAVIAHDDTDPDPGNNSTGPVTTTVFASADLSIEKSGSPDPVTAGSPLDYTLTITNAGPSVASGILLTDTLPLSVTFGSASPACSYLDGPHQVDCSLASLSVGASAAFTVNVAVDPAASGTLTNQAGVNHGGTDPEPGNDATGPMTTTVTVSADLELSKTDSSDPVLAGTPLTYTLTITNPGPSVAAGVLLTDTLPGSGITFTSATPGACAHSAGIVTCDLGNLPSGEVFEVEIVVDVDPATTASLFNSAEISASGSDPNPGNNIDSETTQVDALADLAITITDSDDPVIAGQSILTYTLSVTNTGPSDSIGVSVVDDLPGGVTFSQYISTGNCTHNDGIVSCSLGNLDAGQVETILIETTVDMDATGVLVNSANVTPFTSDPNSSNNMDSEDTTVAGTSDLVLMGFDAPDPVSAGSLLTYTLALTNTGPSNAALATITATLPAQVTFVSAAAGQGSCSEAAGLVTCDLGVLSSGAVTDAEVVSTVDRGFAGQLVTTFTASSASTDPVPGDNAVTLTTTSQVRSDLQIQKLDMPEALPPGGVLTYTILVENLGPSDATGVVFTDTLPAEVNLLSVPGYCSGTLIVSCDLNNLDAGAVSTTTIQVEVDPGAPLGVITNTAVVTSTSTDLNPGNNAALQTTSISDEVIDLALAMAVSEDPLLPGEVLTYTLSVTNTGPSAATNVVLTDTLPADVTLISAVTTQGSCTTAGPVVCAMGTFTDGATAGVTIVVSVNSDSGDLLLNSALVSGDQAESDSTNNSADVETTVFTIVWVTPVSDGERYDAGVEIVPLEVLVTDRLTIDRVEFRRWDPTIPGCIPNDCWVPIEDVFTAPYTTTLDSTTLNFEWNEIRARAFDDEGHVSLEPRVWIYRLYNRWLPLVPKNS